MLNIDRKLAWKTTQTLFICIGGTGSIAFAATLQWWLAIGGFGMLSLTWTLLYKLLKGLAHESNPKIPTSEMPGLSRS